MAGMSLFLISLFALFSDNNILHIIICGFSVILYGDYYQKII
jgi:hypothetical protein